MPLDYSKIYTYKPSSSLSLALKKDFLIFINIDSRKDIVAIFKDDFFALEKMFTQLIRRVVHHSCVLVL